MGALNSFLKDPRLAIQSNHDVNTTHQAGVNAKVFTSHNVTANAKVSGTTGHLIAGEVKFPELREASAAIANLAEKLGNKGLYERMAKIADRLSDKAVSSAQEVRGMTQEVRLAARLVSTQIGDGIGSAGHQARLTVKTVEETADNVLGKIEAWTSRVAESGDKIISDASKTFFVTAMIVAGILVVLALFFMALHGEQSISFEDAVNRFQTPALIIILLWVAYLVFLWYVPSDQRVSNNPIFASAARMGTFLAVVSLLIIILGQVLIPLLSTLFTSGTSKALGVLALGFCVLRLGQHNFTPVMPAGKPTITSVQAGDASATVSFTAPLETGNDSSLTYTVYAHPVINTGVLTAVPQLSAESLALINGTPAPAIPAMAAKKDQEMGSHNARYMAMGDDASLQMQMRRRRMSFDEPTDAEDMHSQLGHAEPLMPAAIVTATGSNSPVIIRGLTNGTPYSFTVVANNRAGPGAHSNPSPPIIPAGAPDPPTSLQVAAGDRQVAIDFTPPVNDGGAPITLYQIIGAHHQVLAESPIIPILVTGLDNGHEYTLTVVAVNRMGQSAPSMPVRITPAGLPNAPGVLAVERRNCAAVVSFSTPPDNGSTIRFYTVTATCVSGKGRVTAPSRSARRDHSPVEVTELTNGLSYVFTVTAENDVGIGPASVPSQPVTIAGPPGMPAPCHQLTPTSPYVVFCIRNNGGAAITSAKVSITGYQTSWSFTAPCQLAPAELVIEGVKMHFAVKVPDQILQSMKERTMEARMWHPFTCSVIAINEAGESPSSLDFQLSFAPKDAKQGGPQSRQEGAQGGNSPGHNRLPSAGQPLALPPGRSQSPAQPQMGMRGPMMHPQMLARSQTPTLSRSQSPMPGSLMGQAGMSQPGSRSQSPFMMSAHQRAASASAFGMMNRGESPLRQQQGYATPLPHMRRFSADGRGF